MIKKIVILSFLLINNIVTFSQEITVKCYKDSLYRIFVNSNYNELYENLSEHCFKCFYFIKLELPKTFNNREIDFEKYYVFDTSKFVLNYKKDYYLYELGKLKFISNSENIEKLIRLQDNKYSNVFLLNIALNSPFGQLLILLNDNEYKYYGINKKYSSFEEYIENNYPSINKFIETVKIRNQRNEWKKIIENNNIMYSKKIVESDYNHYFMFFPSDTLKCLELLIDEFNRCISLSQRQEQLLYNSFKEQLNSEINFPIGYTSIPFYNQDLTPTALKFITKNQFFEYLNARDSITFVSDYASDKILKYLKNNGTIQEGMNGIIINKKYKDFIYNN
jgi:hypothetical protein